MVIILIVYILFLKRTIFTIFKMIHILIVGLGGRFRQLYDAIQEKHKMDINVVAVVDDYYPSHYIKHTLNPKRKINPHHYTFNHMEQAFQTHEFDWVFITGKNNMHVRPLEYAVKYNKHCFMEKPITDNLEEIERFQELYNEAEKKNLHIQIGLTLQYAPIVERMLELSRNIFKGRLYKVFAHEYLNVGHASQIIYRNWRRYKETSGGLIIEKAIHEVHLLYWIIQKINKYKRRLIETYYKSNTKNVFFGCLDKREEFENMLRNDKSLYHSYHKWDTRKFERIVKHPFDPPPNNNLTFIPDQVNIMTNMVFDDYTLVQTNFDLQLAPLRPKTERGIEFHFEDGTLKVDFITGKIDISVLYDISDNIMYKTEYVNVDGTSHAGADEKIMEQWWSLATNKDTHVSVNIEEAYKTNKMGLMMEKYPNSWHMMK